MHAFTIIGAVYREDPATRLPADPRHVFLQHIWDASRGAPYADARQWATRALPHNTSGTSHDGQRFGTEWYIDLGHPEAASYTVDVLTHLMQKYDLDGIHLDRIRYPEAPIDPGGGINVGYNATNVARFNARHGRSGTPATNDPLWHEWRRQQVTNFVRRLYLNAKRIRPQIRVSAALITFGSGPAANGGFQATEAYGRVFQNWRAWAEEGILDLIIPMDYKREHNTAQAVQFDDWMRFTTRLARDNGRLSIIGLGAYINAIEGTLRQARRARAEGASGVVFYSLATSNVAVSPNPFSYPTPNQPTPERPEADFYAALRTGASANGAVRFEPPSLAPLFMTPVPTPPLGVATGHLMGTIAGTDGLTVMLETTSSGATRTTATDGSGFFGFPHLTPGAYRVTTATGLSSCVNHVTPGVVVEAPLSSVPCREWPRRRVAGQ